MFYQFKLIFHLLTQIWKYTKIEESIGIQKYKNTERKNTGIQKYTCSADRRPVRPHWRLHPRSARSHCGEQVTSQQNQKCIIHQRSQKTITNHDQ